MGDRFASNLHDQLRWTTASLQEANVARILGLCLAGVHQSMPAFPGVRCLPIPDAQIAIQPMAPHAREMYVAFISRRWFEVLMDMGLWVCVATVVIKVPTLFQVVCRVLENGILRHSRWHGKGRPFLRSVRRSKIRRETASVRCRLSLIISARTLSSLGRGHPVSVESLSRGHRKKPVPWPRRG